MMFSRRSLVLLVVAVAALSSGCKKKPKAVPQAQVPTITAPETAPASTTPATTEAQQPPAESAAASARAAAETEPKPVPRRPRPRRKPPLVAKKTVPANPAEQQAATNPPATVPAGAPAKPAEATPSIQISARIPHDEALHHRQTTQQLLDFTESNLKSITRELSRDEAALVRQIRNYMEQSRDAAAQADLLRAHNLALKAHLLSDELVR